MYATLNRTFIKQLVLRSYEKAGDDKHCQEDITLETKRYNDHTTYIYTNGDDYLFIRVFYSARITISGYLNNHNVNEALF